MQWTNPLEWLKLSEEDEDEGDVVETTVIRMQWEDTPAFATPLMRLLGMVTRR